jgi:hypothetical protein
VASAYGWVTIVILSMVKRAHSNTVARVTRRCSCRNPKTLIQHLMMEHLAQEEGIQVRLSPTHLLALSEGRNVKVEILDQSVTSELKS